MPVTPPHDRAAPPMTPERRRAVDALLQAALAMYDVSPDGERFVIVRRP